MNEFSKIGVRLKTSREQNDLTIKDVANRIGLSTSTISRYENGIVENVSLPAMQMLADLYKVNVLWLLGKSEEKHERTINKQSTISVPLVGTIAAGTPILAEENIERYFNIDSSIKADFCLRIKGDSMINEGIHNNDIVFIHQQPILENGEIGAVIIDGEATLKRFYKTDTGIVLQPANEKYAPIIVDENSNLIIAGKLSAVLNVKN